MNDKPPLVDSEPEDPRPDITKLGELGKGPTDVRSLILTGLFVLASFYTLYFARAIFLPLALALLLSLLLAPVVRGLKKLRIPEPVGAALLLLALLGAVSYGIYSLSGPAADWIARAPESLRRLEDKFRELKEPVEEVTEEVTEATEQVEEMTKLEEKKTEIVEVKETSYIDVIFSQTAEFIVELAFIIILLYFLLASGDMFLLKLVKVLPRLEDKKRAVEIARQIEQDISIYLLTITAVNALLGAAVGLAMFLLGMPNPMLWGVMAGVLNFIPYLGALVGITMVALVALATFENVGQILLPPAIYFVLNEIESNLVTPMILGQRLTLNPVILFFGLIFWGWLWGIAGALIAVPLMAIFKIICDHVEPLAPIGEFLGK